MPVAIMAQLISPMTGAVHQAPLRLPLAFPLDRHWSLGPATTIWPVPVRPPAPPPSRHRVPPAGTPLARAQAGPRRPDAATSPAALQSARIPRTPPTPTTTPP